MQKLLLQLSGKQIFKAKRVFLVFTILTMSLLGTNAQTWPSGVHDPSSIIKCGDTYWIFATGDGIYAKYSTDMVTWSDGPSPFPNGEFPEWIKNYAKTDTEVFSGFFWAPDIIYMNSKYYLYYSCSMWGTRNSCVGVVVNETLDPDDPNFEWVDQGDIGVFSPDFTSGGSGWDVNAIDPSMTRGHDGKIWLIYGSFNKGGIMIREVDTISGHPKNSYRYSIANSWTGGSNYGEGEGGCMIYKDGFYYLFYNKGGCCAGINSSYYMVMGRSANPRGPFLDKTGKRLKIDGAASGGTVVFKHDDDKGEDDRFYGPGHFGLYRENGIDYVSYHYYSPNGWYDFDNGVKGGPTLGLAKLEWGEDGWPSISHDFLEKGYYTFKNVNSNKALDLQMHNATAGRTLYQYTPNSIYDTQKWLFTPVGSGEYTIRSYADTTKYIEAGGVDNDETLKVASAYSGAINQKFRVVQSPNGKILIYPSVSDKIFEIPYAAVVDYPVKLWWNTNSECQRWLATPFVETLSPSHTFAGFTNKDTVCTKISLTSNGSWAISVEDDSWLSVTPVSGTGNKALTITADENTLISDRVNKITLRSKAGNVEVINVKQGENVTSIVDNTILAIDVYPNPTHGMIQIKTDAPVAISVYNQSGIQIMALDYADNDTRIDISDLNSGIYLFKLTNENGSIIKKVIKK